MRDLERGSSGQLVTTVLSGLVCGILWEMWNFWSVSKWVYTVPLFENLKIFEMPVAGYLGFPVFAVGTIALVNLMQGLRVYRSYLLRATFCALIISLGTFPTIDRQTVFSYLPAVDHLSFVEGSRRDALKEKRVETSYGINPDWLTAQEKATLDLMHLKGLGYKHTLELQARGINTVSLLSQCDETTLSTILKEPNTRRVRVFIAAAKKETAKTERQIPFQGQ